VVSEQRYYPYSQVRWSDGTLPTGYTFTGQRDEAGLGLMDYRARFYDPYLGRFISADTIVPSPGNPQSLNRYSYCLGNPLVYVDPSGHAVDPYGNSRSVVDCPTCEPPSPEKVREVLAFMVGGGLMAVYGGPLVGDLAGAGYQGLTLGYLRFANAHPLLTRLLLGYGAAELADGDDDEARIAQAARRATEEGTAVALRPRAKVVRLLESFLRAKQEGEKSLPLIGRTSWRTAYRDEKRRWLCSARGRCRRSIWGRTGAHSQFDASTSDRKVG
jgi:RHS repeat-associated protein